jgi:hypothetical protein
MANELLDLVVWSFSIDSNEWKKIKYTTNFGRFVEILEDH